MLMCPHLEPASAGCCCCCCCCRPVHILMPANLLETSRQATAGTDDVGSVVAVVVVAAHRRPAVPIQLTVMNAHSCKPYTHNIHQYTRSCARVRACRSERATRMALALRSFSAACLWNGVAAELERRAAAVLGGRGGVCAN